MKSNKAVEAVESQHTNHHATITFNDANDIRTPVDGLGFLYDHCSVMDRGGHTYQTRPDQKTARQN